MRLTRRDLILGAAGTSGAMAQQPKFAPPQAKPRTAPMICLFSKHLPKLHYSELGGVLRDLGFEGCDLTVRPGGHVLPEKAPADLFRAIESVRGDGVEVPMITTAFTSAADPWARSVIAIAGGMGVPLFKPGYWKYGPTPDIEARISEVKREVAGLTLLGRTYQMAMGLHNHSGDNVGEAVWDTRAMIADLDPRWVGYYFDPCHATAEGGLAGWSVALRLALPRLKMMALKDFYWAKESGRWAMKMCPMGEGMVEWPKVFAMLAQARFTGPLSLHLEYDPKDELAAIARDLEFVRRHLTTAYGNVS